MSYNFFPARSCRGNFILLLKGYFTGLIILNMVLIIISWYNCYYDKHDVLDMIWLVKVNDKLVQLDKGKSLLKNLLIDSVCDIPHFSSALHGPNTIPCC